MVTDVLFVILLGIESVEFKLQFKDVQSPAFIRSYVGRQSKPAVALLISQFRVDYQAGVVLCYASVCVHV